jgi:ribonucleoside-diphosphate reductase alpha chain
VIFEQKGVECPSTWSEHAVTVAASKYFFGLQGTPQRETSVRQLIHRVARPIADWAAADGYVDAAEPFYRDLVYLLLHQYAAFNSPVWFNLGLHHVYGETGGGGSVGYKYDPAAGVVREVDPMVHPQVSACFILGLGDSIDSVFDVAKDAARLFKYGSGVGTDLSPLRSKHEPLKGGGRASGPLSFGEVIDVTGGTIKSGGRTRRAAIMLTLKDRHPEIREFARKKAEEDRLAKILIQAGVDPDFNGAAYGAAKFQNANLSARLTDELMEAAEAGGDWQTWWVTDRTVPGPRFPAADLMDDIVDGTWECGDPGVQFETTIQRWHTCPNTAPINSSNPCSEFKFLDDTACNLLSLRLTRFRRADGGFDVDAFAHAVRLTFMAQEVLVGRASYPTPRVAEMSHKFRPLGIGYADLGALLMVSGLAYDSDEGRALCAAVTALMTGEAYRTSAEMAARLGAFDGFEANREPMLKVIGMHASAVLTIPPTVQADLRQAAWEAWEAARVLGETHGFRNAQASVLAPTGTISFLMDCDTTGVEPELGLVKYKALAGGGHMKLVNRLVPAALDRLGYSPRERDAVVAYVADRGTPEGCPVLKREHLPVFDTSFRPEHGSRSIPWQAHLGMMAAAQPFISGAISKTVNLPADVTKAEIRAAIYAAWRDGLKAVAMYRDGSKWSQPLSTKEGGNNKTSDGAAAPAPAGRRKLPATRPAVTHHFNIAGHDGYLTVGLYDDGTPGELFIKMNKEGSTVSGLMDTVGILTSMCLQHGVPLDLIANKLSYMDFEPRGFTQNPEIRTAKSPVDYTFLPAQMLRAGLALFP